MVLNKSLKQILFLYSSTLLGVLLGIVTSVINTRVLQPVNYGDYRYVQNIIAFISSLLLLGYFVSGSRLLAISSSETFKSKLRGILVIILFITNVILLLCLFLFYLYSVYQEDYAMSLLYLCSLPLCGNVLMSNYINTVSQGDNHINRIALARLLPSFAYILIAIPCYSFYNATPELMLVLYNGSAILILSLIIYSTKPLFTDLGIVFKKLHRENKTYGFNVYLGSVFGVSTQSIIGIALGMFCLDNSNVGFYTLAYTIASPLAMLPGIIGTTYFKRFANESRISNKVLLYSFILTVLSCFLFNLLIDFVVGFLYSESYKIVGSYSKWLAIGLCMHGFGDMFNRFLGSHGQGAQLRNAAFVCGTIILIGCFTLIQFYQISGAIITRLASSFGYMIVLLIYYKQYTCGNR